MQLNPYNRLPYNRRPYNLRPYNRRHLNLRPYNRCPYNRHRCPRIRYNYNPMEMTGHYHEFIQRVFGK